MTRDTADEMLLPSPKVESMPLADGALMIVDLDSGGCWQLNRVGREAWNLFQGGASLVAVVDGLAARYPVSRATLLSDVESIVRELRERGLLIPLTTALG